MFITSTGECNSRLSIRLSLCISLSSSFVSRPFLVGVKRAASRSLATRPPALSSTTTVTVLSRIKPKTEG